MAHSEFDDSAFASDLYLNPNEQDLLITALNSAKPGTNAGGQYSTTAKKTQNNTVKRPVDTPQRSQSNGNSIYTSPSQKTPGSATFSNVGFDNSPYLDYDLDEANFDWDLNGEMIGSLPGGSADDEDAEQGDKRKSPGSGDEEDGGGKRREGDDKTGKKPGRKPLTSEPTSKRKAQNRAAQRAFRERKEKHLKELETKVDDLEKASESANHENGLLRAQVDRLQTELKEYRKRLSTNNNAVNRGSPTSQAVGQPFSSKANWDINNNFQFEFPKFGPHSQSSIAQAKQRSSTGIIKTNTNTTPRNSSFTSPSPRSIPGSTRTPSMPMPPTLPASTGMDELSSLFSPEVLASVNKRNNLDYPTYRTDQSFELSPENSTESSASRKDSSTAGNRSVTDSNSASPASSGDNGGFVSSCVTTPESSADLPQQRRASGAAGEGLKGGAGSHEAFCKEFSTACGNKDNPVPLMITRSDNAPASNTPSTTNQMNPSELDFTGFEWLTSQNGGTFDPVLFGDYRDPQENIMSSDYNEFFNNAFAMPDLGSPLNQTLATAPSLPKKKDLMQEIEEQQAGKEPEVVPGESAQQFLTCNLLWDRVQRSERVQNGEADMDDLCSQLKSKAKCSGSGAVIAQSDVDNILGPAPSDQHDALRMFK